MQLHMLILLQHVHTVYIVLNFLYHTAYNHAWLVVTMAVWLRPQISVQSESVIARSTCYLQRDVHK